MYNIILLFPALRLEGEEIEHLMSSGLPPMSFVGEQLSLDLEYNLTGQDTHQIKKFAEFARDLLSTAQVKWREVGVLRTQLTSKHQRIGKRFIIFQHIR